MGVCFFTNRSMIYKKKQACVTLTALILNVKKLSESFIKDL